jgi:predicted DNA-binding transcriptional regulator AlpA
MIMANDVVRLTPDALQRYNEGFETPQERERRQEREREAVRLAREEERRALAEEEQRRAAELERLAERTAFHVMAGLARSRLEAAPAPTLPAPAPPPPPQLPPPIEQPIGVQPGDEDASTVDEFCKRNRISRSTFYKLARAGTGPQLSKLGKSTRIYRWAERLWQRQREAAN